MDNELFSFLTSQGVFALLFGYLLIYILKQNQVREENYQNIIKQLSNTVLEIQNDLEIIKELSLTDFNPLMRQPLYY